MDGLLLIDKPKGLSSFGVVYKVRKIISDEVRRQHVGRGYCQQPTQGLLAGNACKCKIKVGHSGTLDPAATGLLILAVGKYTKRIPSLIKKDKTYLVSMSLGQISSTGDQEGQLTAVNDNRPTLKQINQSLQSFSGEIMQTPPIYSAIKVNGQRAYDLARQGKEVILQPRRITIYSNKLISYQYPVILFESQVSSGTYIRSLAQDIGEFLGTGAYMSDLKRTKIANFTITDALDLTGLTYAKLLEQSQSIDKKYKIV